MDQNWIVPVTLTLAEHTPDTLTDAERDSLKNDIAAHAQIDANRVTFHSDHYTADGFSLDFELDGFASQHEASLTQQVLDEESIDFDEVFGTPVLVTAIPVLQELSYDIPLTVMFPSFSQDDWQVDHDVRAAQSIAESLSLYEWQVVVQDKHQVGDELYVDFQLVDLPSEESAQTTLDMINLYDLLSFDASVFGEGFTSTASSYIYGPSSTDTHTSLFELSLQDAGMSASAWTAADEELLIAELERDLNISDGIRVLSISDSDQAGLIIEIEMTYAHQFDANSFSFEADEDRLSLQNVVDSFGTTSTSLLEGEIYAFSYSCSFSDLTASSWSSAYEILSVENIAGMLAVAPSTITWTQPEEITPGISVNFYVGQLPSLTLADELRQLALGTDVLFDLRLGAFDYNITDIQATDSASSDARFNFTTEFILYDFSQSDWGDDHAEQVIGDTASSLGVGQSFISISNVYETSDGLSVSLQVAIADQYSFTSLVSDPDKQEIVLHSDLGSYHQVVVIGETSSGTEAPTAAPTGAPSADATTVTPSTTTSESTLTESWSVTITIYLLDVPYSAWTDSYDDHEVLLVVGVAGSIPVAEDRVEVLSVSEGEAGGSMVVVLVTDFSDATSAENVKQIDFIFATDLGEAEVEVNEPVSGHLTSMGESQVNTIPTRNDTTNADSDLIAILVTCAVLLIVGFVIFLSWKKHKQNEKEANISANLTRGETENVAIELNSYEDNAVTEDMAEVDKREVQESQVNLSIDTPMTTAFPMNTTSDTTTALTNLDDNISIVFTSENVPASASVSVATNAVAAPVTSEKKTVTALRDFKASKPVQMSFTKGDIIEVYDTNRAWHAGVLLKSSAYPITGKRLYYPPKFVRATKKNPEKSNVEPVIVSTSPDAEYSHVARRSFQATKPNVQMSFAKGDLIKAVDTKGKWHKGILVKSSTHPITGKLLYYPPTLFSSVIADQEAKSSNDSGNMPVVAGNENLVVTKCDFKASKASQMSFSRGDVIQVLDTRAAWHRGILKKSKTHPCNDKVLYFPPNFVSKLNVTPGLIDKKSPSVDKQKNLEIMTQSDKKTLVIKKQAVEVVHKIEVGDVVIAIRNFTADKPVKLSFVKGDSILVTDTAGTWYRGQLQMSSKYKITGKALFFPPTLVQRKQIVNE